jgi:riboflavin kinase/FMN adenylyltransferase
MFDGQIPYKYDELVTQIADEYEISYELAKELVELADYKTSGFNLIKDLTPREFIENILLPLGVKEIYIGEDFRFGKNRSGDISLLKEYFEVEIVPFELDKNIKISSTKLIELIKDGKVEEFNRLTNRNYEIKGTVVDGLKNGRKINFPTANIKPLFNYVLPKNGVYKTLIYIFGVPYLSVTNIGYHPTIDKLNEVSIETHILNFDMDIYGANVYIEFISFIREEKKFNNIEELKEQLKNDIDNLLSNI